MKPLIASHKTRHSLKSPKIYIQETHIKFTFY